LPHLHLGSIDSEHLLATVYNAADVFVIPSMEEAFGQTALESLACGRPVVGSDVGGIPDMVSDGETGLLVEPGNAAALATALDQLAEDQHMRAQLGSNARELVLRDFSFQKNAESYVELYRAMMDSCSSK
jgi:glycosyltransferase involved in cell wall biosynthesis